MLPPSDTRDFDEQKKGFIAEGEAGNVVWDKERCRFILEGEYLKSIHPSLLRQSTLNMNYGLCEVSPGLYPVRGFDLANITFVKGETGWIVFDPLTAAETAAAGKRLLDKHQSRDGVQRNEWWIPCVFPPPSVLRSVQY